MLIAHSSGYLLLPKVVRMEGWGGSRSCARHAWAERQKREAVSPRLWGRSQPKVPTCSHPACRCTWWQFAWERTVSTLGHGNFSRASRAHINSEARLRPHGKRQEATGGHAAGFPAGRDTCIKYGVPIFTKMHSHLILQDSVPHALLIVHVQGPRGATHDIAQLNPIPFPASRKSAFSGWLILHRLVLHRLVLHRLVLHRLVLHRLVLCTDNPYRDNHFCVRKLRVGWKFGCHLRPRHNQLECNQNDAKGLR